jgi:hypothetical protein
MATEPNRPAPVDPETQPTPAGVAADLEEEAESSGATTEPRDGEDVDPPKIAPEGIEVDEDDAADSM